MNAFITINVVIKNPEKFVDYMQKASATLAPYGAKPVAKGKFAGSVSGSSSEHQMAATVTFPDMESIDAWYNSDEYQALIPLRDEAADIIITKYSAA
ncbi:MAG: DUF1330 domain-containing protein [Candidatus Caenarcaniphilales bacterium]|nr:DUF1330 domain-containing protein [Candidatus Caenarcaniphilales bacterium]